MIVKFTKRENNFTYGYEYVEFDFDDYESVDKYLEELKYYYPDSYYSEIY